jgi:DNA repair protein RadC
MQARERYGLQGPQQFGDVDLLALVLGTGTAKASALEIGARLLREFGDLSRLARAEPTELAHMHGIGIARAVRVHAALQLGRRSIRMGTRSRPVHTSDDAWAAMAPALTGLAHEELHALYLDRRHRPIAHRVLTRGSDGFTVVDPRQIYRPAIQVGAVGVILAHNHPSGDPTPSPQDLEVTRRVQRAGHIIGIPLVDHLVIGQDDYERVELPAHKATHRPR